MNIFILDTSPILAAQYQCDKHVVKMILESAQIMSTIMGGPYKPTHQNHPCVLWAKASEANYSWLAVHALALCAEYTHRYDKRHKCQDVIEGLELPISWPSKMTPFVQCMPEQYKQVNSVDAYRAYYRNEKAHIAVWSKRDQPAWWSN